MNKKHLITPEQLKLLSEAGYEVNNSMDWIDLFELLPLEIDGGYRLVIHRVSRTHYLVGYWDLKNKCYIINYTEEGFDGVVKLLLYLAHDNVSTLSRSNKEC